MFQPKQLVAIPFSAKPCAESAPLPATISPERSQQQLSAEAQQQIAQLNGPRPRRFLLEIGKLWATIAVTIAIAAYCHNILATVAAIIIIGGRQSALGLMMHEQAHYLGLKSRWGDTIVNVLVCYPLLFVNVLGYARIHLTHHRYFFGDKDPDIHRKSGHDWAFPMTRGRLAWLFTRNVLGLNLVQTIIGKNSKDNLPKYKRLGPNYGWTQVLFMAAIAVALTLAHGWGLFLIYWLIPLMTTLQAFVLLGALCEHVYCKSASLESSTAIIMPTWWEKAIFPDFNFFYHVYHHYFPGVAFANLPQIHAIYVREGLVREDRVFRGIYRYLDFLTSQPQSYTEPVAFSGVVEAA